jgi:hypothetical protein
VVGCINSVDGELAISDTQMHKCNPKRCHINLESISVWQTLGMGTVCPLTLLLFCVYGFFFSFETEVVDLGFSYFHSFTARDQEMQRQYTIDRCI